MLIDYLIECVRESRLDEKMQHERCKPGTHWNEKMRRCVKISGRMHTLHHNARQASRQALISRTKAKRILPMDLQHKYKLNDKAAKAHQMAVLHHDKASRTAGEEGFPTLALHHQKMKDAHEKLALTHRSEADKASRELGRC